MPAESLPEELSSLRLSVDELAGLDRPALLARLKETGVALPARQRLAKQIAQRNREQTEGARAAEPPAASVVPADGRVEWLEWAAGSWRDRRAAATGPLPSLPPAPGDCRVARASQVLVIDGVLTRGECARLMERAEQAGMEHSLHAGKLDAGFRRGRRAALTDGGLAAEIFERIRRALPPGASGAPPRRRAEGGARAVDEGRDGGEAGGHRSERGGESAVAWGPACGVWEQLRVLSYDSDDFFLPHRDNACGEGGCSFHPAARSFHSLLIYLKDSEDGSGATRFHLGGDVQVGGAPAGEAGDGAAAAVDPAAQAERSRLAADVVPWAGRAVVFPHRLVHESLPVGGGCKWVMRSDVLYSPPDH